MKNPERVAALLAELRVLADNDFERHRIDVLERDLTAPPTVEIIDDNNQKFGDFVYREQRSGHYVENLPLHRAVWSYYHGEIPADCQIHHIDENPRNNGIKNLQCLTIAEHRRLHNKVAPVRSFVCQFCGKTFEVCSNAIHSQSYSVKFCSNVCRDRYKFLTKTGSCFETRTCIVCGKEFKTEKRSTAKTCCRKCTAQIRWNKPQPKITAICVQCGKTFETGKYKPARFCSEKCRAKSRYWKKKSLKQS